MNQKHLLRFIKYKLKEGSDEAVIIRDGKALSLKAVFESLKLTPYELSVDTLDMHANNQTFHRFDKFNLKYNPIGESRLREIFLKYNNYNQGRFLAEITHQVMDDLEQNKVSNTHAPGYHAQSPPSRQHAHTRSSTDGLLLGDGVFGPRSTSSQSIGCRSTARRPWSGMCWLSGCAVTGCSTTTCAG